MSKAKYYIIPLMSEEAFSVRNNREARKVGFKRVAESELTDVERAFIVAMEDAIRLRNK